MKRFMLALGFVFFRGVDLQVSVTQLLKAVKYGGSMFLTTE